MIAPLSVEVGRPVRFEGYAEDYGVPIVTVQFSLDDGENWTDYDVSVNERGGVSPEPDTATFIAFAPEG